MLEKEWSSTNGQNVCGVLSIAYSAPDQINFEILKF